VMPYPYLPETQIKQQPFGGFDGLEFITCAGFPVREALGKAGK
jgi:hypothetical protein